MKSNGDDPPKDQPHGWSLFYYSNGLSPLSPQSGYQQGWIYNYQDVLNGLLLSQQDYDSTGQLVQSQTNYWKVYTSDANAARNLWGGYARLVQTITVKDGVTQNSYVEVDATTGLPKSQDLVYCDTNGVSRRLRTSTTYATQVTQYKQMFVSAHYYSAVVQSTQSVTDDNPSGTNPTYIASKVTTWKNWAAGGAARLAPVEILQWTTPGAAAPVFDFGSSSNAGWLSTSKIISRVMPAGMIREQIDSNQVRSSFLYDKNQRYLLVKFPGGSIESGEVSYTGFESYETEHGWSFGAGAAIVPNTSHPEIDSHSGINSVRIEASTTGTAGITRTFNPSGQQRSYVFSAWVKKPRGFDSANGKASWTIAIGGGSTTSLNFPAATGQWLYVAQVITLGGSRVTISAVNANASSYVLVDDVRFTPLSCLIEATPYDTRIWKPNVLLGANGEASRTIYNPFEQIVYQTNAGQQSSKITRTYFSRSGNEGHLSAADPNATLELRPMAGGALYTFNDGDGWANLWNSNPPNSWHVAGGRLTQNGSSGALRITDSRYTNNYSIATTFETSEPVSHPLGCHFGSNLTIRWDAETLRWQLLDGNGSPLLPAVSTCLFSVPTSQFTAQLDAGQISNDLLRAFLDAGYPLPNGSTVVSGGTHNKQWVITGPDPRLRYYLLPEGATLGVYQPGNEWTFFVGSDTLLFWVGGKRIFSYESATVLSAAPELFFGNKVAISALMTGLEAQARITFDDAGGNPLQSQLLSGPQAVVSQNLYDAMGRQAVRTKAAYVDPTGARPLMAYRNDFAAIDWATGIMTGLMANAYPADDGYPYSRSRYEASPLERVIEQGMPGSLFRVGMHSSTISYSADDGTFGLPRNQFYKTTVVNPNGDTSYEVTSQLQQVAGKVSIQKTGSATVRISNQTLFDAAGNPYVMRSPKFFSPPGGSAPEDWAIVQTFDYAGRVATSKDGRGGTTQWIYDSAGHLRFMQDPQGAADGNYNYWKYDRLGRMIESGYVTGAWSKSQLQNSANTDPAAPATPGTWRTQTFYDDTELETHSIGRVWKVLANNGHTGTADVTQAYAYDVYGNIRVTSVHSTDYDRNKTAEVEYAYDNVGNIVRITYPEAADRSRVKVHYRYGALSRVTAVSAEPDFSSPLATYSYSAAGLMQSEAYGNGVTRDYTFNSCLWIRSISDRKAGNVLFGQQLSYIGDGYGGAAYYDGTIAAVAFQSTSGGMPYDFKYSYDSLGRIQNGASAQHPDWNLGISPPVSYDANGNFAAGAQGGKTRSYQYFPGTQQLQKVTDSGSTIDSQYRYDKNGNAIEADTFDGGVAMHDLAISYDPGSKMTTSIADSAAGGKTLHFQYGDGNQRIVKAVYQGSTLIARKLYVRGTNIYPLYEASTDGTEVVYIFGPSGVLAMRRGGAQYIFLRDHLGSIRRVLDSSAAIVASYDYLPFGTVSKSSEPSPGFMPYLFTGHEYDREVALYNCRARFYDSGIGRFLAVDPRRQFFSPYIYCANNPVLYIDPSGMFSFKSFFSAIAGAIIGAVEIVVGLAVMGMAVLLEPFAPTASVVLGILADTLIGAGMAAVTYSVFNVNDFSWKDYGIQMGVGAAVGAITSGFGKLGGAAAKGAKTGQKFIEVSFNVAGGIAATAVADAITGATPGADLGWSVVSTVAGAKIPGSKSGYGNLGNNILREILKAEGIGIVVTLAQNATEGNDLDEGLLNAAFGGALSGTLAGLQAEGAPATQRREHAAVHRI